MEKTAKERFAQLEADRQPYLDRAREASKLTIPSLLPPEETTPSSNLYQPYQSIGSRGVNNLASKLLLALMPPNSSFFTLTMNEYELQEEAGSEDEYIDIKEQVKEAFSRIERVVMEDINNSADRVTMFEALKHLVVAGNGLLYVAKEGTRFFALPHFVCQRDPSGNLTEIVIKEEMTRDALPEDVETEIADKLDEQGAKKVSVFTWVRREDDKMKSHQEVMGVKVDGTEAEYPVERSPYIALRLNKIDGESYGRSYIEEYIGDLHSLEILSEAIVKGSAAAAKVLFLVNPNGTTRQRTLAEKESGAIAEGDANDVSVLQMEKYNDFRVAQDSIVKIEERLSFAMLLNTAIQRNAERVTAAEIRYMAQELEDALGGIYSILSQEFQEPYVLRKMKILETQGKMPKLPRDKVNVTITTGIQALGKGHDRNKLIEFLSTLGETLGAEQIMQYVDIRNFIARLAASDGIDTKGLIKSEEQIQQEQQQAQMQQMTDSFGPEAMKMMQHQMDQQNGQGGQ